MNILLSLLVTAGVAAVSIVLSELLRPRPKLSGPVSTRPLPGWKRIQTGLWSSVWLPDPEAAAPAVQYCLGEPLADDGTGRVAACACPTCYAKWLGTWG